MESRITDLETPTMDLVTTRFGTVTIDDGDVLTFADGLIGMEDCCRWALLADAQNQALGWFQSLDRAEVALAVVSPRRFLPDYRVRVSRRDVQPLRLERPEDAQVLVIVNQAGDRLVLNLKAPLVIHLDARLGRQIVARDDHAVQHPLSSAPALRKSA
jgi:flagellar assembly factor FliW